MSAQPTLAPSGDSLVAAAPGAYAKDDYVLLLPEYTFGMVSRVCYAKVTRVKIGRIIVTTKRLIHYAAVTVSVNTRLHKPAVVTKAEYTGGLTGTWLRKIVITLSNEEISSILNNYSNHIAIAKLVKSNLLIVGDNKIIVNNVFMSLIIIRKR